MSRWVGRDLDAIAAKVNELEDRARKYAEGAIERVDIPEVTAEEMERITRALAWAWATGFAAAQDDAERPRRRRTVKR